MRIHSWPAAGFGVTKSSIAMRRPACEAGRERDGNDAYGVSQRWRKQLSDLASRNQSLLSKGEWKNKHPFFFDPLAKSWCDSVRPRTVVSRTMTQGWGFGG